MEPEQLVPVTCPNCGEAQTLLVDASIALQEYTQDCEVCCRPMSVTARVTDAGRCAVAVKREDEV